MEIIFVNDSMAKISESLANLGIDMNDITDAEISFFRQERIVKITSSSKIGQADIVGTAKKKLLYFVLLLQSIFTLI